MRNVFFRLALYLLSVSFILGQLARIPLNNEVAIIALDVSMAAVVGGRLLFLFFSKKHSLKILSHNPLFKPLLFFFSIGLISLLVNSFSLRHDQLLVAFLYLLRLGVYYTGFLLFGLLSSKEKIFIQKIMMTSGLILLLFGYLQLLLYPDMRNLIYLGWDDHYYRMVGTFLDPNFFGLFLVFYLFFIINRGIEAFKNGNKKYLYCYVSIALVAFIAIFLTYSRTALLSLIVGMGVYLSMLKKLKYLLLIGVISLLLVGILANTKYESLNPLRTASIRARIIASQHAVTIIQHNPVLGVGYNAYRYAVEKNGFSTDSNYPQHGEAGTDNSFLFVTATTGIIGLISFLFLWGGIVFLSRSRGVVLASLMTLFIGSFFVNALFYPFLLLWIIILFSVTPDNQH